MPGLCLSQTSTLDLELRQLLQQVPLEASFLTHCALYSMAHLSLFALLADFADDFF
jgi:hypothetical protein